MSAELIAQHEAAHAEVKARKLASDSASCQYTNLQAEENLHWHSIKYYQRGGHDESSFIVDADGDLMAVEQTHSSSGATWVLTKGAAEKHGFATITASNGHTRGRREKFAAKKGYREIFIKVEGEYALDEYHNIKSCVFVPSIDAIKAGRYELIPKTQKSLATRHRKY